MERTQPKLIQNHYSVLFIKEMFKITKKNCKLKSVWIQKLFARNIAEIVGYFNSTLNLRNMI